MGCNCGKPATQEESIINTEKNHDKNLAAEPVRAVEEKEINQSKLRIEQSLIDNSQISKSRAEEGSVIKKKKKKVKKAADFNIELYNLINQLRKDPSSIIPEIKNAIQYIKKNTSGKGGDFVFEKEGHTKTTLNEGEPAFLAAIERLRNAQSMAPLEFHQDLAIQVPETSTDWTKKDVLAALITEKKQQCMNRYSQYAFHFDMGMSDPVLSLVLQVVDDNNFLGQRRNNILNPNYKYIGISHQKSGKTKFCTYLTFAA